MEPQLRAAKGYIVIYTNPRGSIATAKSSRNLLIKIIRVRIRGSNVGDRSLNRTFLVDEDQLYVTGGSGGEF